MENPEKKIVCKLCGKLYHLLEVHIHSAHGYKLERYKAEFPGAPVMSESAIANKKKAAQRMRKKPKKSNAFITHADIAPKPSRAAFEIGVARLFSRNDLVDVDIPHVPEHDDNFLPETAMTDWEDLAIGIEDNEPIFIHGPTGCGKTIKVMQLAHQLNQPVRRIQLNRDFKASEFVGHGVLKLRKGLQVSGFKDGVLTEAYRLGHWLMADEFDQTHPDVWMKCQAILEGAPLVLTENFGEVVPRHPDFRFIAAANTLGKGDLTGLYAGAKVMNEATMDRFGVVIAAGYPEEASEIKIVVARTGIEEDEARKMVAVARKVREALINEECYCTFSTRRLVAWAKKTARHSGDAIRASRTSVLNRLEREDSLFVAQLVQRYFGGQV